MKRKILHGSRLKKFCLTMIAKCESPSDAYGGWVCDGRFHPEWYRRALELKLSKL